MKKLLVLIPVVLFYNCNRRNHDDKRLLPIEEIVTFDKSKIIALALDSKPIQFYYYKTDTVYITENPLTIDIDTIKSNINKTYIIKPISFLKRKNLSYFIVDRIYYESKFIFICIYKSGFGRFSGVIKNVDGKTKLTYESFNPDIKYDKLKERGLVD